MERNNNVYSHAIKVALKVEFLANSEEFFLYANALYAAMMWGREADRNNQAIRERNKGLK